MILDGLNFSLGYLLSAAHMAVCWIRGGRLL